MREQIGEVVEGARDALLDLKGAIDARSGLTDEEVARQYVQRHRDNPAATLRFVQKNLPEGKDPFDAAIEYERTMEAYLERNRRD